MCVVEWAFVCTVANEGDLGDQREQLRLGVLQRERERERERVRERENMRELSKEEERERCLV